MSAWRSISVFFQKIDDHMPPNIKSGAIRPGEVVFDKAIFSINDKSVKKVYNEIMRHKVHKRRVKKGLYYIVENIEAYERLDSNPDFQVKEEDLRIKPVLTEAQKKKNQRKALLHKASLIKKSKAQFLEDKSKGSSRNSKRRSSRDRISSISNSGQLKSSIKNYRLRKNGTKDLMDDTKIKR
jgi:hypothetical protein